MYTLVLQTFENTFPFNELQEKFFKQSQKPNSIVLFSAMISHKPDILGQSSDFAKTGHFIGVDLLLRKKIIFKSHFNP